MKTVIITRTVLVLSMVSLCTDIASEMLYPVMPLYLKSIGFSVVIIGVLEGFAEAVTGLSKGYFGNLSDQWGKRLPFVRAGYFLSALSKPMMAILVYPLWIFFARSIDRLGKGIRTSARDAILSDESSQQNKGKVFGFHRAMDTFGATLGPLLALVWLYYNPGSYKTMFVLAFIPGIIAIALTLFLKEKEPQVHDNKKNHSFFNFFKYWKQSRREYKLAVIGLVSFTLFNSSDVFLLLMLKEKGFSDYELIMIYMFYNLIYALFSYPSGFIADKIGLKTTFLFGLSLFFLVYLGMAVNTNTYGFFILFFLYGIYAACTEGISKAWLSNMASKEEMATALGFYGSMNSLITIMASSLAGLIWYNINPPATFLFSASGSFIVLLYFIFNRKI